MNAASPIDTPGRLIRKCCAVAMLCIPLLTGCVGVVPVPTLSSKPVYGERVTDKQTEVLLVGKTSKAKVIHWLGTNYCEMARCNAIAYPWELAGGYGMWFFAIPTQMGPVGKYGEFSWGGRKALFLAFNDQGILVRKAFHTVSDRIGLHLQLERWAARSVVTPVSN